MIVKREPKSDRKEAVKLSTFFSKKDNIVYPIKSDLQRRFCWLASYIDKLFKDYIMDFYDKNCEADLNGEDCFYATIGDGILTRIEEGYGINGKCKTQEVIDWSQRMTTIMSFISVMLFLHCNNNNIKDVEERQKLFDSYLKTKNGLSWKIISTFKDSDFEETINSLVNGSFKTSKNTIKSRISCFTKTTKKNEVVYKSFVSLCSYVYNLIDSTIGLDDKDIKKRLDLFLDKTYIQIEECEEEDRVAKFREVNTFRLGISDENIYKTLLCDKGESVDAKFQDFEESIKAILTPQRIKVSQSGMSATKCIMQLAIIIMDDTTEMCKRSYSLEDEKNGITKHIKNGLLDTEEKVIKFLDICIDICNFLKDSMLFNSNGFNAEWYLLAEGNNKSFIWFYNILPAYVISKIKEEDKKTFAFEMLLKSYVAYSIKYSVSRSVAYMQVYSFLFTKEILANLNSCFDDFKLALSTVYLKQFSVFIKEELTKTIKKLDYEVPSSKTGIHSILLCLEYLSQKQCGIKRDNIIKITKKDEIELDHILPKSKENYNNDMIIDGIGNLVLLEKSLNASKQNKETLNSRKYSDSSFITTKLMIKGNRYESLTNEEIDGLYRTKVVPFYTSEEKINNFENEIEIRRNEIIFKIKDFLTNI